MKKILVIDESSLFREYLSNKLIAKGFEVVQGTNGLDGSVKMRRELPDLIITDYYLTRKTSREVLEEKKENPNTAQTPVIVVSSRIDREQLVEMAPFNVKKFFTKPLKIDVLLKAIAELLDVTIEMDSTPSIMEAHLNDEILLIEIAMGLNIDKIELLRYKITELMELYHMVTPRILIMLSNIELSDADTPKLGALLSTVLDASKAHPRHVKILTTRTFVKDFLAGNREFGEIGITDNLETAMDELIGMKGDTMAHDVVAGEKLLRQSAHVGNEAIEMRFSGERQLRIPPELESMRGNCRIAVVDDDVVIQELIKTVFSETNWTIRAHDNGREFVDSLATERYDMVFLDLVMPEMDGFQVLAHLRDNAIALPVIVLSALSKKETVVKAVGFGVTSYMIKPLKPERILMKAAEVLKADF